jgi:hypothetical protein
VYIPGLSGSNSTSSGALVVAGGVGISGNLYVGGSGYFSGNVSASSYNNTSDYRLKRNIKQLDNTFNLEDIVPMIYNKDPGGNLEIGFIAHEVQKKYPFLVNGTKDGEEYQSINYIGLIGILVNEIKMLKEKLVK